MATSPSPTTSIATTSFSLTSASPSASPICNKNFIPDLDSIIPASISKEGLVCAFPLAVHLNFTSCCTANQTIYHTNVCTQYCVVNENETLNDFGFCVNGITATQNLSLGISGCKKKSSGTIQASRWKGSTILVGVAMLLFVI